MPKIIILTGCTRGCGRALVDRFIEAGHTVVGCGRSEYEIEKLQNIYPAPHRFDAIDVTDDASVSDWAKSVLSEVGTPDLLINNAAVINRSANLWELTADEFENVIDINIKGVANTIRHFTPAMIKRQQGVIVNFSSGWGRSTSPQVAPYCATKFAVEGLSKALAQELPEGIASIPLSPGVINTEMLQSCSPGVADNAPTPEEWSHKAAAFILNISASDNGKSLSVG
jgi:NAD(P)-dependent dehydrogenase (short-subunit alcohol dehydrogenase family)